MINKAFNVGFAHKLNNGYSSVIKYGSHFNGVGQTNITNDIIFHNLTLKYYNHYGYGYFSGNVDIKGQPAKMKIKLYLAGTKILVQETESLIHNGYFEFSNIADNELYDMYAISDDDRYETKVKEGITCLKNHKREISFSIVGVSKAPPINTRAVRFTLLARNTINKPVYEIKDAPEWLTYDENTGLCTGYPNEYLKSIVLNCTVYDGDKSYEFIRTVIFQDTRFIVEYSKNSINVLNDLYNSTTIQYEPVTKVFENFPKGGQALVLGDDYIHYKMNDEDFKNITTGSYTIEITCKVNELTGNGVLLSSDATKGNNRFCVGYNNTTLYFNINGKIALTKCSFTQSNIINNEWFVITIVKDNSKYYGFYNGVLIHQWDNTEHTVLTDNFYVGNNKFDNTAYSNITVRKVRFTKNIAEFDDTYSTEYSFVDEKVAFPKIVFTHIDNNIKPDDYVEASYVVPTKSFMNNGVYWTNAYGGNSGISTANQPHVKLPTYNSGFDLGTSSWSLYFDILIGWDTWNYYSDQNMYLLSTTSNKHNVSFYIENGFYNITFKTPIGIGGDAWNIGYNNKISRKPYLLKRHFFKVVRKKNYLYFFIDGLLSNKISISSSKTYNILGGNSRPILGHNSTVGNYGYNFAGGSTSGLILRKNIADIENYDIYEKTVSKYYNIYFAFNHNKIDSYYDDKLTINGVIENNDRFIRNLSKQNFVINDVYDLQNIMTMRLTGLTYSTDIRQNLLTLHNPTTNEHISIYTDIQGLCIDVSTNIMTTIINDLSPKVENKEFDIMISSNGKEVCFFLDGIVLLRYELTDVSLFTKCIIGSDINEQIKITSSSSVALFQYTTDTFFNEDMTPMLKNEYMKDVDFKYLIKNARYNDAVITNLYNNNTSTKKSYSHIITEMQPSKIRPFGDWTLDTVVTLTSNYSDAPQWVYGSSDGGNSSTQHLSIRFTNTRQLQIVYGGVIDRINSNGIMYTYTSSEIYKSGDTIHIAIVRCGHSFMIWVDGKRVTNAIIYNIIPFNFMTRVNNTPMIGYNTVESYFRGVINWFRILNGISLYNSPTIDHEYIKNNIPSENISTYPTTTSLPLRFKESFKE